jgi:hypothetical protein
MERRQFTDEFKREAVRLASQPGISKAEISKDLEINANMLHCWPSTRPTCIARAFGSAQPTGASIPDRDPIRNGQLTSLMFGRQKAGFLWL